MKLLFVLVVQCCTSSIIDRLSFKRPFDEIAGNGERTVSSDWQHGGATVVNKLFARLTPDRTSKRGYLWNSNTLNMQEFSIIFTFRISGQAEHMGGDGIALWLTTAPSHVDGDVHGSQDRFTGIGVIFDTFENTDHPGGHRDVTVLMNNGRKGLEELQEQSKQGCDMAEIRYHDKHPLFSAALNVTRAKIQVKNNFLTVSMDPRNAGQWTSCYESQLDASLYKNWLLDATLGVTASTGGLADNHDVIELSVYDQVDDEKHVEHDQVVKVKTEKRQDVSVMDGDDLDRLKQLQLQFEKMQEDFDHQFSALKETTANTIQKLRLQEDEDERRIIELEMMVNGKVHEKMSTKMDEFNQAIDTKLDETVADRLEKHSGWKTPFFILVLSLGALGALVFKKYQELRKTHLL